MDYKEFNNKYKEYLEKGHYGLDINIPSVVEYLDGMFEDLINIPNFSYSQIKLKFNSARVYMSPDVIDTNYIEKNINKLVKEYDESFIKTGI